MSVFRKRKVLPLYCSWCGKNEHEVAVLIAGPKTNACDECVTIFVRACRSRGVDPVKPEASVAQDPAR